MDKNSFISRHAGINAAEVEEMLNTIGVSSLEELIDQTIPSKIRLKEPLQLDAPMTEYEYLNHIRSLALKNKLYRSYIGMGYYNTISPAVILRNVLENPGWYTSYTPYQAEISQGRLEALLNYQTMISDLTALPIANSSLLDEATAATEAMLMFYHARDKKKLADGANSCFIDENLHPQTIDVIMKHAIALEIELHTSNFKDFEFDSTVFGAIVQYPNQYGEVNDYREFVAKAKENGSFVAAACDILSLALLTPPGEWGADCAIGSVQRLGLPMGFGGPAAGFFACKENFKRQMPGRIIGVTVDSQGKRALRMALQTREQHIKREKATSNICTASALMASMAGFYAIYHGQEGIYNIANRIHTLTEILSFEVEKLGYKRYNEVFFDTLTLQSPVNDNAIRQIALTEKINFRYTFNDLNNSPLWDFEQNNKYIGISLDETTTLKDVNDILSVLAKAVNKPFVPVEGMDCISSIPQSLQRTSGYLSHPVFNTYHSETQMMRYMKELEIKDLSLNRAMIPLGSCTMKLNAAAEMIPLSFAHFQAVHPFAPIEQVEGYLELIRNLKKDLATITGFADVSLQPLSGASGECAGLMVIDNYQLHNHGIDRKVCLIPSSAHGTNPASAAKAGFTIVTVKATENGEIDIADLKQKAEQYKETLSCMMITYPSTHGVFEESILEIIDIIHENGGLVYMDGANMNAQVGLTNPGFMGADVCHLNLHKTFAMPHGGGGPGLGPIAVSEKLRDFLPGYPIVGVGETHGCCISGTPYGYPLLLPITYGYIKMLGAEGLQKATELAILNANYMAARLKDDYKILYTGKNGRVAHEMILDCNSFSMAAPVGDLAKRLMDYGFHAPTVAFPVHGTLMVEPTESEPLSEINRFCDALIQIRKEVADIESGKADKENNLIRNAPHTASVVCSDEWDKPYSRQEAAFPTSHPDKYWPTVSKVDDAYGDRNLVTCVE
ncbi:MAG: aminomethyl-transferring glycine dehydrogenase [Bacteroidales bacterium]|jgi:glycine dehydrogenase|nr:aminomethyl-transferring glycine dehydrogenase [Bacteroidales bacterium]